MFPHIKVILQVLYLMLWNSRLLFRQVVRCFEDNDIVHVNGQVDPKSDIDVINLELAFCDMDQVFHQIQFFTYCTI